MNKLMPILIVLVVLVPFVQAANNNKPNIIPCVS